MSAISEKPAATARASPKKHSKHFSTSLRDFFTGNNKTDAKIFAQRLFAKYTIWEGKDFTVEGTVGWSTCRCGAKTGITREIQRKGVEGGIDNLRFEQAIEGGTGRCVKTLPASFQAEFVEFKSCRTEKLEGEERKCSDGRMYELLWEKDYGVVECIQCGREIEYVNQVRRYEGKEEVGWFLSTKA